MAFFLLFKFILFVSLISYFVFFILFSYLIKHFDKKFDELLKRYSEPKNNLFIIKFLLSQYIIVLDKTIQNYLTQSSSSEMNNVSGSNNTNFSVNSKNTFNYSNNKTFNNSNNYGIRPA